jgi:hypothetical protein
VLEVGKRLGRQLFCSYLNEEICSGGHIVRGPARAQLAAGMGERATDAAPSRG